MGAGLEIEDSREREKERKTEREVKRGKDGVRIWCGQREDGLEGAEDATGCWFLALWEEGEVEEGRRLRKLGGEVGGRSLED